MTHEEVVHAVLFIKPVNIIDFHHFELIYVRPHSKNRYDRILLMRFSCCYKGTCCSLFGPSVLNALL